MNAMPRALTDISTIAALSPRDVSAYLRSRGWQDAGPFGDYGHVFRFAKDGTEVVLSTTNEARDFARRMIELVEDVARIEGRSPHNVIDDLALTPFDVVRIRSGAADSYGSIKLGDGVELYEEARNILLWAANAAASPEPRKVWTGRRLDEVNAYLDNVRLGQTQRGSFVLTVLSPWHFTPNAIEPLTSADSFGRRATRKLASALLAIERSIRRVVETGSLEAFSKAVPEGVSSNLCASLARLAEDGGGIDVSVDWSASKPVDGPVRISLTRENASVLTEAARELAQQEPDQDVVIEGVLSEIKSDKDRFDGSAVIEARVENALRRIRVTFDPTERNRVFDAARDKKWVRVVGDLRREGRRLHLLNPHRLDVVDLDMVDPADE